MEKERCITGSSTPTNVEVVSQYEHNGSRGQACTSLNRQAYSCLPSSHILLNFRYEKAQTNFEAGSQYEHNGSRGQACTSAYHLHK